MKRMVVCPACSGRWERVKREMVADAFAQHFGEEVKIVAGYLRSLPGITRCDDCNRTIGLGAACAAVTVCSTRNPYAPWEREYLHPA